MEFKSYIFESKKPFQKGEKKAGWWGGGDVKALFSTNDTMTKISLMLIMKGVVLVYIDLKPVALIR